MNTELSDIRHDFEKYDLNFQNLDKNPLLQVEKWVQQAIELNQPEPTAMNICTVDAACMPHSRIVLLKGIDQGLVFYTNYNSEKGRQITANNKVAAHFFWHAIERQIHIQGTAEKIDANLSDAYFSSRPRESQIGAWASAQSTTIESYKELEDKLEYYSQKFAGSSVPRPPHWGGYRITPISFEFWQGRPSRLHKRYKYTLHKEGWQITMVAP